MIVSYLLVQAPLSNNAAFIHTMRRLLEVLTDYQNNEKTTQSTVQPNLNQPGKFISLYCNVFQFEESIFHCSLIVVNICSPYYIIYKYYHI